MSEDVSVPFDSLALQPGVMLQIHSALEVTGDFLPVGLLGYLRNFSIIVTSPIDAGKVVSVKEGTHYNVKGFSGTAHFAFKAKVVKVHAQPFPHLHLEYPKLVHTTKIRKGLRAAANLPATLFNPFTKKLTPVMLRDLSVGGGQLVLPGPIVRKDDTYTLNFKIKVADDLEEEVSTEVIVRALDTQNDKGTTIYTMGVQFLELGKLARLLVMTFVYRQQLRKE